MKKKFQVLSVILSILLVISLTNSVAFAKKIKPPAPAVDIVVTGVFNDVNLDRFAGVGDTITYSYTVSNIGNVELTGVAVTGLDVLWNDQILGTLASNTSDSGTATYTLTAEDLLDEVFVYNATVTGTAGTVSVTDTAAVAIKLNLLKFADIDLEVEGVLIDANTVGVTEAGDTISYTFTITNTGTEDLTSIILTDNESILGETGYSFTGELLAAGGTLTYTPTTVYTLTSVDITTKSVAYSAKVDALFDDDIAENEPADSSVTDSDTFIYEIGSVPVTGDAVQKLTAPVNNLSTPAIFTDEVPLFYQKVWRDIDLDNVIDGNELFLIVDETTGEIVPITAVASLEDPYAGDYQLQVDPPSWTEPSVFQTYIVQQVDGVWKTVDLVNNDSWNGTEYTILVPDGKPDLTYPERMWVDASTGFLPEHAPFYPQSWSFTDEALAIPAAPETIIDETTGETFFDPYCLLDNMLWNKFKPDDLALQLLKSDATTDFYANAWQADWSAVADLLPEITPENPLMIDFIDWGNPLENTYPLVGYRFPIELYLYTKLPEGTTMTGFKMTCLENPHSATELYATGSNIPAYATQNSTTVGDYEFFNEFTESNIYESQYATVLTTQFYCEVEAPDNKRTIVDLEPAIGPSGKMNFASSGGGWVPYMQGTHRIYFYVSDPLISFKNAICNNDEHYIFSLGFKAEELSSSKEGVYIVGGANYTWIDVEVKLPNSNGGRKK